MHRGDTARVDAAALRAAALPSSLGRPSASSGSAQGSSRAETHHAAAAACAVSGRAAYSQVFNPGRAVPFRAGGGGRSRTAPLSPGPTVVWPTPERPCGTFARLSRRCGTRAELWLSAGGRLAASPLPRGVPGVEAPGEADSG